MKTRKFVHIEPNDRKAAMKKLLGIYKNGAKKRDLEFELTDAQFYRLIQGDCWYCDVEPIQVMYSDTRNRQKQTDRYCLYNGIDRINNDIGYVVGNVVPCCGRCNKMKMKLSFEDFTRHIRHIAQHLGLV